MSATQVPSKMQAILVKDGKGPAKNLYLGEADVPKLGADELLVKIKAFGLNRMDILQREGQYPIPPGASTIIGVEFSGHVVSSTAGGDAPKEGDEVFGLATGGAYAEYIAVPSRMTLKKPTELSWEQAASIPENFLTAFQALQTIAGIKEGEDVLIHAGASGVGLAAIQLARGFGAKKILATAGSEEKVKFIESMGATGINYKASDWAEEVSKHTNKEGVNIVMDFIGAPYLAKNIASLKRDGRLVLQGMMGGLKVSEFDLGPLLYKRLHVEGSTLRSRDLEYQCNLVQDFLKSGGLDKLVMGVKEEGQDSHRLVIHKVYSWKDIQAAHEEMEANKNTGKIILVIDP